MSAVTIDGRAVASALRAEVRARVETLRRGGLSPRLVVSFVGHDAASAAYVRSLQRAGEQTGVDVGIAALPAETTEAALRQQLANLANEPRVDGIVLAQPLPEHLKIARIASAIPAEKDVDGTSPSSLGLLAAGSGGFVPATPAAILRLLDRTGAAPLEGKRALVIGRSRVVGLPVALLLLARNATVTIAHSRTIDLPSVMREAQIVVAAAGVPGLVRGEMLADGAVVIDAGTSVVDGRVVGDVDAPSTIEVASALSPVPGGVGPVTNVLLMENVVTAAERRLSSG